MKRVSLNPFFTSLGWTVLVTGILAYSLFSYSLTAPNLILTNWQPYWEFQTWMWQTFFNNRELLATSFAIVLSSIFVGYALVVSRFTNPSKNSIRRVFIAGLILGSPLLFASNALSYDVFNYIFNAKMVTVYHANPHVSVALDFAYDPWTRFMHNTHTPAPYAYGWTILSLVPYLLGFQKFLLVYSSFRIFSYLSYALLGLVLLKFLKKEQSFLMALTFLNPLVMIEVIGNSHNDLWMMVPALLSLLLIHKKSSKLILTLPLSILLLLLSISIKMATILLAPVWLGLVIVNNTPLLKKKFQTVSELISKHWALAASILLFLPLMTLRSQQFLPWYATWSVVWIPFFSFSDSNSHFSRVSKLWASWLIALTISSLARYYPFLQAGEYSPELLSLQKLITWLGAALLTVPVLLVSAAFSKSRHQLQ